MSLINDALKNARKHQRDSTAKVPPLTPVRPAEAEPRGHWPLGIFMVLLLLAACALIVFAIRQRSMPPKVVSGQSPVAPAVVAPAAAPAPLPLPPVKASTAAPSAPVPVPAPISPPPPVLKLQGILYDPVHPMAIVSGKTVRPGDVIKGFKVKSISLTTLVLVGPDQKETSLTMDSEK